MPRPNGVEEWPELEVVKNHAIELFVRWRVYHAICQDCDFLEAVNRAAPSFSRLTQRVYLDDLIRHVCILTDPPGDSKNLSVLYAVKRALEWWGPDDASSLQRACDSLFLPAEPCSQTPATGHAQRCAGTATSA